MSITAQVKINPNPPIFLQFLINTSRVFWKEEITAWAAETGLEGSPAKLQAEFIKENPPAITSKYLSEEQNQEQQLHLANKIYMLGYNMIRHKVRNKAYLTWCMDYKVEKIRDSKGRSGKSLIPQAFEKLKTFSSENGRDVNLTKKNHIFGDVTSLTDLLFINDCHNYLDVGFFFNAITDNLTINPKNISQRTIGFHQSGKIIVTSNFGPHKDDDSTLDRILFCLFSDWYHSEKDFGIRWDPACDFGGQLFDDWDGEEWNRYCNLMAQCCQFAFTSPKINPDMGQILKRQNLRNAGDTFIEFCEEFIAPWVNQTCAAPPGDEDPTANGLVDYEHNSQKTMGAYLIRKRVLDLFHEYCSKKETLSQNKLKDKLRAWCESEGIVINPPSLFPLGTKDKHGVVKVNRGNSRRGEGQPDTLECFYLYRESKPEEKKPEPWEIDNEPY